MADRLFDRPLSVRHNESVTVQICSVRDALDFLEEKMLGRQDRGYEVLVQDCHDVLEYRKPIRALYDAFLRLALHEDLLVDPASTILWMRGKRRGRGSSSP